MDEFLSWINLCLHERENVRGIDPDKIFSHLCTKFHQGPQCTLDARLERFLAADHHYIIPLGSQWYPGELLQLKRPPLLLFAVGNLQILYRPRVAVVGTRRATPLGRTRAQSWSRHWVRAGSVVVSGLAAGIDQAAHEGAFPDTVGVLAFGHDYHYPPENLWLREKMEAEGGLTLSAYAPWESGRKYFFLERNTIMAALSKTVVIMEAPLRSGALHTAEFALDLGRDVFAIPGNPEQLHYAGNLHLIQQGAWPLTHPSELFTDQRSKLPLA